MSLVGEVIRANGDQVDSGALDSGEPVRLGVLKVSQKVTAGLSPDARVHRRASDTTGGAEFFRVERGKGNAITVGAGRDRITQRGNL